LPAIYYDPEGRKLGSKRTKLHAKCVVVDRRWAFVTSANFTEAAQERNIEAGVLLDQPRLAASLVERFAALRDAGVLRRANP
jgi:phosphatidylserine/phosphatidylglycerophosphate/cardiolipin synthase-like enzyme